MSDRDRASNGSPGGVYTAYGKSLVVEDCTITQNSAVSLGGGMAAYTDRILVYDTTVSSNTVEVYQGAGIFVADGIYRDSSGVRLDNTIAAGNRASSDYHDIYGTFDSTSSNNLIGVDTGLTGILPACHPARSLSASRPWGTASFRPRGKNLGAGAWLPKGHDHPRDGSSTR